MNQNEKEKRDVEVIMDADGHRIVVIHDIRFHGRRNIDWDDVEEYLYRFVDSCFVAEETGDLIYVSNDFPDEYSGSKYTASLKGTYAKAKANAGQGIPELVKVATNRRYSENEERKHKWDARNGWFRYDSRFALPVYNNHDEVERYNIFRTTIIVRVDAKNKLHLYDIINIKKEPSTPLET